MGTVAGGSEDRAERAGGEVDFVELFDAVGDTLRTIQKGIEGVEAAEAFLEKVESVQDRPVEEQAVFVIRLLLKYLDEDRRAEALKGFVG